MSNCALQRYELIRKVRHYWPKTILFVLFLFQKPRLVVTKWCYSIVEKCLRNEKELSQIAEWPILAKNGYGLNEEWPILAKKCYGVNEEYPISAKNGHAVIEEYPISAKNGHAVIEE